MRKDDWVVLLSTVLIAGVGVFLAADIQDPQWSDFQAPKYVLGSVMAIAVAIRNFFRPAPHDHDKP
jgi:hypothetical protein